jgi:DNA mismatch repair protein MutS
MSELTSILKRNNCNTLILADEVCKGTETKSASIIIASMLILLENSKASFITASHLHNIMELQSIKKLNLAGTRVSYRKERKASTIFYNRGGFILKVN